MKTKVFPQHEPGPGGRDLGDHAFIYCPGCKAHHSLRIRMPAEPTEKELKDLENGVTGLWDFNGDLYKPTFIPSLDVFKSIPERRCHSFITGGHIQFLPESHHHFKGETMELPDLDI